MTREEAIEILADKVKPCLSGTDWNDAIDMAIKALEQEPTDENLHREREQAYMQGYEDASKRFRQEPCEDCISRKSIKQKLQEHHDFFVNAYGGFSNLPLNDKSRVDEISNCIAEVLNEPSVTPQEPKTGHWIEKDGFDGDTYYDCSECGESWTTIEGTPWDNEFKYCPNCGARMGVEDNG